MHHDRPRASISTPRRPRPPCHCLLSELVADHCAMSTTVEQSPQDDRSYRYVVLPNGLPVLLISDSTTDKASAALDVRVGHLSDPDCAPGLAHFLEHVSCGTS